MAKMVGIEKVKDVMKTLSLAETELSAARAQAEGIALRVGEADRELAAASALAITGRTTDRQEAKRCEAARDELRRSLTRAMEAAEDKRRVVESLRDELAELKSATTDRLTVAAVKKSMELMATLRRQQADLLKTARRAVALHSAVESFTPQRVVSQRVPEKFLRVVSDDPAMQEQYKSAKPPGSFSVEPLKAIAGARAGKWRIVEGQDLTIDPSEIETVYNPGPMPEEIKAVEDIELGKPIGATGEDSRRELNFGRIQWLLTEDEIAAMTKELEQGG